MDVGVDDGPFLPVVVDLDGTKELVVGWTVRVRLPEDARAPKLHHRWGSRARPRRPEANLIPPEFWDGLSHRTPQYCLYHVALPSEKTSADWPGSRTKGDGPGTMVSPPDGATVRLKAGSALRIL